jgi:hypothetical protein
MIRSRSLHRLLARLSLLVATVSYLTVAVVGPIAHLAYLRADVTKVAEAPGTPGKHDQLPKHDESHCLICHSLESVAAPATGTSIPLAELRPAPAPPEPAGPAADTARPLASARAPPLFA